MCVSGFVFEHAVESGKGLRNEKKIQCFDRCDGRRLEPLRKKRKKEKKDGFEVGWGWGGLRYDIISSLFATAFLEENQCWIVCCESHCFSVCVCLLHRVVLICLHCSSASLLPLLLLLWLASGIIERDIYQNRSCICR